MSNPVYQATVERLEEVLAPRVVARSLKEGLRQLSRSPEDVGYDDLERILKAQIYRQLQVAMPVTQAKDKIAAILEHIRAMQAEIDQEVRRTSPGLERQRERLHGLRDALKPYNLYFEWPEVQKLRAQIQLLEQEQEAGHETPNVVGDAEKQLGLVEQKLEDQLVIQAREIGEIEGALEQVRDLGVPKVRRLEGLLGQIKQAQAGRQLAPAEVERARKLGRDLRRTIEAGQAEDEVPADAAPLEASARTDAEPVPDPAPSGHLLDVEATAESLLTIGQSDPEVRARLQALDVEAQRRDLDALEQEHGALLAYLPALRQRVTALRGRLEEGAEAAADLDVLSRTLQEAVVAQRDALRDEMRSIEGALAELGAEAEVTELRQALVVALGILQTSLPSESDVQHIRNLHRLAREQREQRLARQAEEAAARDTRLREQAEVLARLEANLLRYEGEDASGDEYARLADRLGALRDAQEGATLVPELVVEAHRAEEQLEATIARRSDDQALRDRARLRALLAQVNALPDVGEIRSRVAGVRRELERQLEQGDTPAPVQVDATTSLVDALRTDAAAEVQGRLRALAAGATELGDRDLLGRVQAANDALEAAEGGFPDLDELARALKTAVEARRAEQIGELHGLEQEASRLDGLELPEVAQLQALLVEARRRIDQSRLAEGLGRARALLELLRSTLADRLRTFEPRLDRALEGLERVAKLNSDEVASARRILHHLDSQREAFGRVSTGLQIQLERSLGQAEALIERLGQDYEATRAVAEGLVSGNVLDDVLGLFGGAPEPATGDAACASPDGPEDASGGTGALERLLTSYLDEHGVEGAAAFRGEAMLGGRLRLDADALAGALDGFEHDVNGLGASMELGGASLVTLEMPGRIMIAAWPTDRERIVVVLDVPAVLSQVLHKLRHDLDQFRDLLGGPALA